MRDYQTSTPALANDSTKEYEAPSLVELGELAALTSYSVSIRV